MRATPWFVARSARAPRRLDLEPWRDSQAVKDFDERLREETTVRARAQSTVTTSGSPPSTSGNVKPSVFTYSGNNIHDIREVKKLR